MAKKTTKQAAQKRARKAMKAHAKSRERHKAATKSGVALSENAVQHQMLSEFGNMQNFVKNIVALAGLMRVEDDLKTMRFNPDEVYAKFDLAADREPLADAYAKADDYPAYDEKHADFWREKRRAVLKDLVTEEFQDRCERVFKKLILTKKGFKKEYRAVLAGHLLAQSQRVALTPTEAPLEDNNLWELILLATIKDHPRELPAAQQNEAEPATAAVEEPPAE